MPMLFVHYGLFLVALIIFAGEIGLPTLVPGEIALLIGGSQFIHSPAQLIAFIGIFGVVDIVATTTIHTAARTGGCRLLLRLLRCLLRNEERHEEVLERWRQRLHGYDSIVVFVTRLIPMFRLYASISTGLIRIRFRHFLLGVVPASFVWATTPLTIGFLFRQRIRLLETHISSILHDVVLASVLGTVLIAVGWWMLSAGAASLAPRRFRATVAILSFLSAFGWLLSLAASDTDTVGRQMFMSLAPMLPLRIGIITVGAIGLLWIASRDLDQLRRHHLAPCRLGKLSTVGWAALTLTVALFLVWNGSHAPLA